MDSVDISGKHEVDVDTNIWKVRIFLRSPLSFLSQFTGLILLFLFPRLSINLKLFKFILIGRKRLSFLIRKLNGFQD